MNSAPIVEACPNCGAPLDLDEAGKCRWCRAHVRAEQPWSGPVAHGSQASHAGLVPAEVDDQSVAPFIYLTLATLGAQLSREQAVQAYLSADPGLREMIRQLSTAVGAAGARARDSGLLKDGFDENLRVYTPEEIWTFDLAFDVIALLGALDGLPRGTRASVANSLRLLRQNAHSRTWSKDLRKAGPGPGAFRALRARIPPRTT